MEAITEDAKRGGKIDKSRVRKKSPERKEKITQALRADIQKGGRIDKSKVRKKSPERKEKLLQAMRTDIQKGGRLPYHDARHKYLHQNLSGKGAHHDSPMCRKVMHTLMSKCHPSIWSSYVKGKTHDIPTDKSLHLHNAPKPLRRDPQADVIHFGGSIRALSHSENGMLTYHDSDFHNYLEIV